MSKEVTDQIREALNKFESIDRNNMTEIESTYLHLVSVMGGFIVWASTEGIEQDDADARALSITDYFLHPVLLQPTEENIACIEPLHKDGFTSIKFFLSFNNFDRNVQSFLTAMRITKAHGGISLIHCEDAAIMDCCCTMLRRNRDIRFRLRHGAER